MLWIVGKSLAEFRNYLTSNAVEFGIFWDKSLSLPKSIKCPVVPLDFQSSMALPAQLQAAGTLDVSAVVVAGYENYVLPAAHIARFYSVPGPSIEAAVAATDKAIMRQKFIDYNPALSPDFAEVTDWQVIEEFMASHSFPVMLKPASLMKSLLITKNTSSADLRRNYDQTTSEIAQLYGKYSVGQKPKIIIEEFLQGSMHTVAAFANHDGKPIIVPGVVDCITGQEIGHDDNFLYSRMLPSRLSAADQQQLTDVAAEGMRALRLTDCPAHIELILTDKGPKIIEIGARIGGYRPRMYDYAYGIDLQGLMIENAHGHEITINRAQERAIAAFELFPDGDGIFAALDGQEQLASLQSLRHYSLKVEPGDAVGLSSTGYKTTAVIILASDDKELVQNDAAVVRQHVAVRLRR